MSSHHDPPAFPKNITLKTIVANFPNSESNFKMETMSSSPTPSSNAWHKCHVLEEGGQHHHHNTGWQGYIAKLVLEFGNIGQP